MKELDEYITTASTRTGDYVALHCRPGEEFGEFRKGKIGEKRDLLDLPGEKLFRQGDIHGGILDGYIPVCKGNPGSPHDQGEPRSFSRVDSHLIGLMEDLFAQRMLFRIKGLGLQCLMEFGKGAVAGLGRTVVLCRRYHIPDWFPSLLISIQTEAIILTYIRIFIKQLQ